MVVSHLVCGALPWQLQEPDTPPILLSVTFIFCKEQLSMTNALGGVSQDPWKVGPDLQPQGWPSAEKTLQTNVDRAAWMHVLS